MTFREDPKEIPLLSLWTLLAGYAETITMNREISLQKRQ
jgi:hypothetical protein